MNTDALVLPTEWTFEAFYISDCLDYIRQGIKPPWTDIDEWAWWTTQDSD